MDLTTRIGALTLRNPVIAASGCFGYGVEYAGIVDLSTLGGVCVKGLFRAEREGHPPPRIVETPAGMLNAIGLQGIGVHRFVRERLPELRALGATVFVNICGDLRKPPRLLDLSLRPAATWRVDRPGTRRNQLALARHESGQRAAVAARSPA